MKDRVILETFRELVKETLREMMKAEREEYLRSKRETKGNGYYRRGLKTILGEIKELEVPRTRDGEFRSELLPYRSQRTGELDDLIVAMITSGISTRRIGDVITKLYGYRLSAGTISKISKVSEEKIESWRKRPLEEEYSVIFIDTFFFSLKRDVVEKEAIYIALGIRNDGYREVLGYWIPGGSESSMNWDEIFKELKGRGVKRVYFIVSDGLNGMDEAIMRNFPEAKHQDCLLHVLRNISNKVRAGDRIVILNDFKNVYKSISKEEAYTNWEGFKSKWKKIYPGLIRLIEKRLSKILVFMELPVEIRCYVYTNNSVERLIKEIKRRIKNMEMFQNEGSAYKYLFLILKEQNERYMFRRLKNWEYYFNSYLCSLNNTGGKLSQTQLN